MAVTRHKLAKERGDAIKNAERKRLRRQRSAAAHLLSQILAELADSRLKTTALQFCQVAARTSRDGNKLFAKNLPIYCHSAQ